MIVDAAYIYNNGKSLQIIDHKTGKIREEQLGQLELCIIGGFHKFPEVQNAKADFWYLDQGETRGIKYTRKDLPKLKAKWKKRTRAMLNDKIFAPCPGNACRWCFYKKANKAKGGGQCEY